MFNRPVFLFSHIYSLLYQSMFWSLMGCFLPQINQFLSLFFMVMVQVVITTEWFVINMPLQVKRDQLYPECDVAKERKVSLGLWLA